MSREAYCTSANRVGTYMEEHTSRVIVLLLWHSRMISYPLIQYQNSLFWIELFERQCVFFFFLACYWTEACLYFSCVTSKSSLWFPVLYTKHSSVQLQQKNNLYSHYICAWQAKYHPLHPNQVTSHEQITRIHYREGGKSEGLESQHHPVGIWWMSYCIVSILENHHEWHHLG